MVDLFDAIRMGESSIEKLIKHQIVEGEKERSFEMLIKEAKGLIIYTILYFFIV